MLGRRALKGWGRTHYIIREHAMTIDAQTRVLFIEDERELQRAYGRYFGSRYDVAVAGTGTEVVARLDGFILMCWYSICTYPTPTVSRSCGASAICVLTLITTACLIVEPMVDILGLRHQGYLLKPFSVERSCASDR